MWWQDPKVSCYKDRETPNWKTNSTGRGRRERVGAREPPSPTLGALQLLGTSRDYLPCASASSRASHTRPIRHDPLLFSPPLLFPSTPLSSFPLPFSAFPNQFLFSSPLPTPFLPSSPPACSTRAERPGRPTGSRSTVELKI